VSRAPAPVSTRALWQLRRRVIADHVQLFSLVKGPTSVEQTEAPMRSFFTPSTTAANEPLAIG